jgi:hypothetical protein
VTGTATAQVAVPPLAYAAVSAPSRGRGVVGGRRVDERVSRAAAHATIPAAPVAARARLQATATAAVGARAAPIVGVGAGRHRTRRRRGAERTADPHTRW